MKIKIYARLLPPSGTQSYNGKPIPAVFTFDGVREFKDNVKFAAQLLCQVIELDGCDLSLQTWNHRDSRLTFILKGNLPSSDTCFLKELICRGWVFHRRGVSKSRHGIDVTALLDFGKTRTKVRGKP